MSKWRKRPVEVEALQWLGTNRHEVLEFIGPGGQWDPDEGLIIGTREGMMLADEGDWIIRGIMGEHYPCKPDIFAATYEAVDG